MGIDWSGWDEPTQPGVKAPASKHDIDDYPHKCPRCECKAFVGVSPTNVSCSNYYCKFADSMAKDKFKRGEDAYCFAGSTAYADAGLTYQINQKLSLNPTPAQLKPIPGSMCNVNGKLKFVLQDGTLVDVYQP